MTIKNSIYRRWYYLIWNIWKRNDFLFDQIVLIEWLLYFITGTEYDIFYTNYLAIMKLLVTKIEYDRLKDNNETIKNILYFYFIIFIPKFFHWYCHFHLLHIQRLQFCYLEMSIFHLQKSWKILNLYLFCYDHYSFLFHILSTLQFLHLWLK
jgi:hypothetical protein